MVIEAFPRACNDQRYLIKYESLRNLKSHKSYFKLQQQRITFEAWRKESKYQYRVLCIELSGWLWKELVFFLDSLAYFHNHIKEFHIRLKLLNCLNELEPLDWSSLYRCYIPGSKTLYEIETCWNRIKCFVVWLSFASICWFVVDFMFECCRLKTIKRSLFIYLMTLNERFSIWDYKSVLPMSKAKNVFFYNSFNSFRAFACHFLMLNVFFFYCDIFRRLFWAILCCCFSSCDKIKMNPFHFSSCLTEQWLLSIWVVHFFNCWLDSL